MRTFKSFASIIFFLTMAISLHAAEFQKLTVSGEVGGDGFGITVAISGDTALIGASGSQPGGEAYVFCLTLTPEQIGFVIDTLEAQAIDGMLLKGQANSLVSKLEAAQFQLNTENISEVFKQLEEYIKKVNNLIENGKLTAGQGQLLINSTLGVVCRT